MLTEAFIAQIRGNWIIFIVLICVTSYFIYSVVMDYFRLAKARWTKKNLEGQLVELNAQYEKQVKELEDKMKAKDKLIKKGKI